jgi:hypothetical protein
MLCYFLNGATSLYGSGPPVSFHNNSFLGGGGVVSPVPSRKTVGPWAPLSLVRTLWPVWRGLLYQ